MEGRLGEHRHFLRVDKRFRTGKALLSVLGGNSRALRIDLGGKNDVFSRPLVPLVNLSDEYDLVYKNVDVLIFTVEFGNDQFEVAWRIQRPVSRIFFQFRHAERRDPAVRCVIDVLVSSIGRFLVFHLFLGRRVKHRVLHFAEFEKVLRLSSSRAPL